MNAVIDLSSNDLEIVIWLGDRSNSHAHAILFAIYNLYLFSQESEDQERGRRVYDIIYL